MAQYHCRVDSLFIVPPESFTPRPKVDSAIVRLIPHETLPARGVDAAFWSHPATGFLPHEPAGPDAASPVLVGHGDDPAGHHDVMINLAAEVPDFATRFQRVAEMITGDPDLREAGRARFRFYRERGFDIQSHRL